MRCGYGETSEVTADPRSRGSEKGQERRGPERGTAGREEQDPEGQTPWMLGGRRTVIRRKPRAKVKVVVRGRAGSKSSRGYSNPEGERCRGVEPPGQPDLLRWHVSKGAKSHECRCGLWPNSESCWRDESSSSESCWLPKPGQTGGGGEERAARDFKDEPSGKPPSCAALAAGNGLPGRPQGGSNHEGGARNRIGATGVRGGGAQANVEGGRPSHGNVGSPVA
jgi:hypothetical protein